MSDKIKSVDVLKYIILHARKYDKEEIIIDEYDLVAIFPALIPGKHGVGGIRKQLLLDSHFVKQTSGGYVSLRNGRVNVYGSLTEEEDGIALSPGPEDIEIIQDKLSEA